MVLPAILQKSETEKHAGFSPSTRDSTVRNQHSQEGGDAVVASADATILW